VLGLLQQALAALQPNPNHDHADGALPPPLRADFDYLHTERFFCFGTMVRGVGGVPFLHRLVVPSV
jgi:hypothetical protein